MKQLKYIFDNSNLKIVDFSLNSTNGGSIFLIVCNKDAAYDEPVKKIQEQLNFEDLEGFNSVNPWKKFNTNIELNKIAFFEILNKERSSGKKIAALGASTKGNVTLQTWGVDKGLINVIGDVNLDKEGKITPGSHIPILPEDFVISEGYDCFVVLPWHFREFFLSNPKFSGKTLIFPLPYPEAITL